MKKFVALALFAVMVLMMVPAANAANGDTAQFIAKHEYDGKIYEQYIADLDDEATIVTNALNGGNVYAAEFEADKLMKSYANKYDAVGKAYYYVIIPIPTEIVTGTYKWTSVKLNGEEVLLQNAIEGSVMVEGVLYYVVGYADVSKGFNKTYTWTATNGTSSTTVKYTVKLTEKAAPVDPTALTYNIAGTGEGYAVSTKKGIVYVDIAADWLKNVVGTEINVKANLTLTVDGKSPIPDGQFGYLTVTNHFGDDGVATILDDHAYRSTDVIGLTMVTEITTTENGIYFWDTDKLNIELDIKDEGAPEFVAKNIKVVYRIVEVGDPKGIYFVDGDTKTVELGEEFTLEVAAKEATLTKAVTFEYDAKGVVRENAAKTAFVAVDEGVTYITAYYTYDVNGEKKDYTDTIKIIVAEEPATTSYYVVCRALNVRKGPSTSYGKVGLVYRNDIVDVISVADGWAKIWFDGAERYVSTKYIAAK